MKFLDNHLFLHYNVLMETAHSSSEILTVAKMIEYIKNPRFDDIQIRDFLEEFIVKHRGNVEPIFPALRALQEYRPLVAKSLKQALINELKIRQNPQ